MRVGGHSNGVWGPCGVNNMKFTILCTFCKFEFILIIPGTPHIKCVSSL